MKDTPNSMETSESLVVTDNNYLTSQDDKYSESIDLSNACREFYQSRKRATEAVKEKLAISGRQRTATKTKTSIDVAMETLRSEMASLMDQDLSLMKQLLTLNEAIEDLKWQKKYYHSNNSIPGSSCDLDGSDWSVSETDMYDSESEGLRKYPTVSALALQSSFDSRKDSESCLFQEKTVLTNSPSSKSRARDIPKDLDFFINSSGCHEEQNSFDSGIHEPVHRGEITV